MLRRPSTGRFLGPLVRRGLGGSTPTPRDASVLPRSPLGLAADGHMVLAGPLVPRANPDSNWKPDLIWNFLGNNTSKTKKSFRFSWRYHTWLAGMSRRAKRNGEKYWDYEKRREVYNLLVNSLADTNRGYGRSENSRIPWNQTHTTWIRTVESNLGLSCGTMTWCFLSKYMDWPKKGFKQLSLIKGESWTAALWTRGSSESWPSSRRACLSG